MPDTDSRVERSPATRLHIAIDLTALLPETTGVDVWLLRLVLHLPNVDSENHYTIFVNREDRGRLSGRLPANLALRSCCVRSRLVRAAVQQVWLPWELASGAYDVLHSPSFLMPLWPGHGKRGRPKHLLTVHDMTFFSMPQVHNRLRGSAAFRNAVAASIRRADLVNVPSDAVRQDLPRWVPEIPLERIRVIPYGIDGRFCPAPAGEVAEHINRMCMPQPYLLFVGTIEPRKNLPMLLEGFRRFLQFGRRTYHLVLAGRKGWDSETVYRLAASSELAGSVHFLGYVADEDLPWVYRGASVFVYPSLYEGFGFPPLEAIACGVPVITSQGSSLEENLRGAATMVSPSDPEALAHALNRLLTNESPRREQIRMGLDRAREFHWNRTAQLVVNCYRELAQQARGNACSRIPTTPSTT